MRRSPMRSGQEARREKRGLPGLGRGAWRGLRTEALGGFGNAQALRTEALGGFVCERAGGGWVGGRVIVIDIVSFKVQHKTT